MTEHVPARDFAEARARIARGEGTPEDELLVLSAAFAVTDHTNGSQG
jgi:hypothetical protein